MFADESGDTGLEQSPTRYFLLCALVLHELEWKKCLVELVEFRRELRRDYGLKLRHEIHAREFINKPGALAIIPKYKRLEILRKFADKIAQIRAFSLISVVVDKQSKRLDYNVFENAWQALVQRFENTISLKNFPSLVNSSDCGLLSCDNTDAPKLTSLIRKMRHYNPIPNNNFHGPGYRNITLNFLIEDPIFRDSAHSFLIQCADLCAYLLQQHLSPSKYMKEKAATIISFD